MTFEDAQEAHALALKAAGGALGMQGDRVSASVNRPYSGYFRRIDEKAAALAHAFARGHCFTDGNKRTAFLLMNLLLTRSGYRLRANLNDALPLVIELVAMDALTHDEFRRWLKARIIPLGDH